MISIPLDTGNIADYRKFLAIKSLPVYSFVGSTAYVPDEYAARIGLATATTTDSEYSPLSGLFDYQRIITDLAIRKRKFAVFADCGLGKTLILLEYAKHVRERTNKKILIVSPLMVIRQTLSECAKFYGDGLKIEQVRSAKLNQWLESGESQIGITNYEAMNDAAYSENLGAMILDESSMLKSHYGSWAGKCIEMGRGLDWKLCLTGTPAPNDRIEYAVFLDRFPNVNSFLATFFVNRGQTDNRWELKPHALNPFYKSLADWSIFLVNPETYGWKGSGATIPPIHVEIHHVGLTMAQRDAVQKRMGSLFAVKSGGIVNRTAMSQISKGRSGDEKIATLKPAFIADLVHSWPEEQSLIWCWYNHEQDSIRGVLPEAGSISGDTPMEERSILIEWFCGRICTCERNWLIKNICGHITEQTSTDGKNQHENSGINTTPQDENSTPLAMIYKQGHGEPLKVGNNGIRKNDSPRGSSHTESLPKNTTDCCLSKTADVPFAASRDSSISGNQECTSIIATRLESFAVCSAGTAITGSANSKTTHRCSTKPPCTCGGIRNGRILISKPRVLGFGLNLQCATRQVFSGLVDSYEAYYQAVKRSNRYGATRPLNVHIPITELEAPMVESVLRKCKEVQKDSEEQERIFRDAFVRQ